MSLPLFLKAHRRIILLLVVGVLGWWGYRFFVSWQQVQLVRRARVYMSKGEYRSASLSARQALQGNPKNLEACRVMVDLAEMAGVKEAVYWRKRIVELEPSVLENRLALARTALRFGETSTADQALLSVDAAGRKTVAYQEAVAALALVMNLYGEAEFHFAEALKLDPSNELTQLNLACVRLRSNNPKQLEAARSALMHLAEEPRFCQTALRALLADAMKDQNYERALPLAQKLIRVPEAQFNDYMLCLDVLHRASHADFPTCLRQLQEQAARRGEEFFVLANWMNLNGMAKVALEWGRSLPKAMQDDPWVRMAMVESCAAVKDWSVVHTMMQQGDWKSLDFIRLAILARSLREEGNTMTWRVQWRAAVSAASKNPKSLNLLARMIVGWGWKNELEELLWSIARGSSDQKWALQLLYRQYQKERDSRGLYRVVSQVLDIDPSDRVAKNNRALLGLLLNLEPILAFKSAQDLYRKDPKNPSFVSTYAFALHCRGQTAEGIRIMSALDRRQLQIPSVAAYYGILLANGGDVEKARKYLDLADQAPLLPEERALVTQARKAVNSP